MTAVTFPKGAIELAGVINTPADFDESKTYPAIVTVHPGGGVKEQTSGLYAAKLAEQGFVTLAFDAAYQGESGGEPRFLESPAERVSDVHAAVDYLQSLPYVNTDAIAVVGICAGGGYAVNAAMTDSRIRAVSVVSAVNIGSAWRRNWFGSDLDTGGVPTRDAASAARTAVATGGDSGYAEYVPSQLTDEVPFDMAQAHDYYLTPRAQHPNAQNKYLFAESIPLILPFDAFHLAEDLLTQPILLVAGSDAGSLWHTTELHAKVRSEKKLVVVDGSTHMDFYDREPQVTKAVEETVAFFAGKLG